MVIRRLYILARRIILYDTACSWMRWRCAVAPRATVEADNNI